jgi:hypothetical protein
MEQIIKLAPEHLDEVAARAGMTAAQLREIAERNVRRQQEMKKVRESADINAAGITKYLLPVSEGRRKEIAELQALSERLMNMLYYSEKEQDAELRRHREKKLERVLTDIYEAEKNDAIYALYKGGMEIMTATKQVNAELLERARRAANMPAVQRALYANARAETEKMYGTSAEAASRWEPGAGDSTGSAEYFSVAQPLNYRKNPRPRRYNDSLDHD